MSSVNNIHPLDAALAASIDGKQAISEKILREYPDQNDPRVVFNLGWHEMFHGNLKKGMQMLDAGRFLKVYGSEAIPGNIWRNESLANKTLLFRSEGGFGDQIINFRFAKDFERRGARVVVSCSKPLMPFFSSHGFVCVDDNQTQAVHYDYWVPAMSAAHVLGYDQDTISGKPYLKANPRSLYSKPGNLKVGIRWAGNPQFEHEQHRKFDPQPLIDLHKLDGVTLYSLQRDEDLIDNLPFTDLRGQLNSWTDTAEILSGLDLVITSCTSVAHCSAALGVETWVIAPVLPYYIWAVPGEKSVWYDSVRLFRQVEYGNWDKPLTDVRLALEERLKIKKAA